MPTFPLQDSITGWGAEDVKLFESFVAKGTLEVMRAFDPGIYHLCATDLHIC